VSPEVVYLLLGASLLLAAVLPQLLHRWALSAPIVLVAAGMLVGLLPLTKGVELDPVAARPVVEHLTEVTVLVALMGVGLAIDRPLRWRERASWRAWSPAWRLLGVAMPLTIAGVAVLAWGPLGVALPAAVLLGAALAPTDPVLASDVQVEGPTLEGDEEDIDETDEVRFALTSEAGLNDGLAFPFVYAAIFLASAGTFAEWGLRWFAWELVGKVVVGVLAGVAVGWSLARLAFRAPARSLRLAEVGEPLLALSALLLAYGTAEVVGGYGFLAVFACAVTVRSFERDHDYHRNMHEVVHRLETLLTLIVLLGLGFAITNGVLAHLDWRGVVLGLALVLVIRPVAGYLSFLGHRTQVGTAALDHRERLLDLLRRLRRGCGDLSGGALDLVDGRLHHRAVGAAARHPRDAGHAAARAATRGRRGRGGLTAATKHPRAGSGSARTLGGMPSPSTLLAFAAASVVIIAIPGPSVLFTIGRALSAGRREALLTVVGNALGILTQICALAIGLGPLIAASATAYTALKVVGAGYLVWLGVQAIRNRRALAAAFEAGVPVTAHSLHAVRAGYVVGVTNPKTIVFFAALLPQFVDPGSSVLPQLVALGTVFAVLALVMDGTVALVASRARDWFASSPKRMSRVGGTGGLMMVGLGTGLLLTGRPVD
jgi:sodium/hydrogen antiporter